MVLVGAAVAAGVHLNSVAPALRASLDLVGLLPAGTLAVVKLIRLFGRRRAKVIYLQRESVAKLWEFLQHKGIHRSYEPVRYYFGGNATRVAKLVGASAITFEDAVFSKYPLDETHPLDFQLIAHEFVHTTQYYRMGTVWFILTYLGEELFKALPDLLRRRPLRFGTYSSHEAQAYTWAEEFMQWNKASLAHPRQDISDSLT